MLPWQPFVNQRKTGSKSGCHGNILYSINYFTGYWINMGLDKQGLDNQGCSNIVTGTDYKYVTMAPALFSKRVAMAINKPRYTCAI